jgi:hypothetical protein
LDYPKMNNLDLVSPYSCYSPESCWKLPVVRGFISCARAVDIERPAPTAPTGTARRLSGGLGGPSTTTTTTSTTALDLVQPMCWETPGVEVIFYNLDTAPTSERERLVDGYQSCRTLYDAHLHLQMLLENAQMSGMGNGSNVTSLNMSNYGPVTNITFVFQN